MPGDRTARRVVVSGRSRLRDAALAVLVEKPRHGYEVAREINRRLSPSGRVDRKHVYPMLKQLEKEGLLQSEQVWHGTQLRKVFTATDRAREARRRWLEAWPARAVIQSDLQIRLAFSGEDDIPDLLRAFEERRIDILEEIEENAADEPLRASYLGVAMGLYRSAVDKALKAELEWIEEAVRELRALLRTRSSR